MLIGDFVSKNVRRMVVLLNSRIFVWIRCNYFRKLYHQPCFPNCQYLHRERNFRFRTGPPFSQVQNYMTLLMIFLLWPPVLQFLLLNSPISRDVEVGQVG